MSRILPPCGTCERKGCGAYHDECEKYRDYLEQLKKERREKLKDTALQGYYVMQKKKERIK